MDEALSCSVCLSIFSDPVTLPCGHSFCRGCVAPLSGAPLSGARCPQCRAALPSATDLQLLPTSLTLQSLAQRAKERPQPGQRPGAAEDSWLCPEHDERMKLFCVTDQRLACIICRDGEAHDGHKFKPIREAAAALRRDMDLGLANVAGQIEEIESLKQTQSGELRKAKELWAKLQKQVQSEFEAMHQFLRNREEQVLTELRLKQQDTVDSMSHSLKAMDQALSDCGAQRQRWTQIMEVTDPEMFLRRWSEGHVAAATGDLFKAWSTGLKVVQSPLFQGPYQSHLQFFMWKEMLQVVQPKVELLTLQNNHPQLAVTEDQRSFHYAPQNRRQTPHNLYNQSQSGFGTKSNVLFGYSPEFSKVVPQSFAVSSSEAFSSGQRYWEVEVGLRDFWCVGVTDYFLKYEGQKYFACEKAQSSEVSVSGRLLKLGVYLDCVSKSLSFYDGDSMERVHEVHCDELSVPVFAFFSIRAKEPDGSPITICRY